MGVDDTESGPYMVMKRLVNFFGELTKGIQITGVCVCVSGYV